MADMRKSLSKLKVIELREKLTELGKTPKGLKADLVNQLAEAYEEQTTGLDDNGGQHSAPLQAYQTPTPIAEHQLPNSSLLSTALQTAEPPDSQHYYQQPVPHSQYSLPAPQVYEQTPYAGHMQTSYDPQYQYATHPVFTSPQDQQYNQTSAPYQMTAQLSPGITVPTQMSPQLSPQISTQLPPQLTQQLSPQMPQQYRSQEFQSSHRGFPPNEAEAYHPDYVGVGVGPTAPEPMSHYGMSHMNMQTIPQTQPPIPSTQMVGRQAVIDSYTPDMSQTQSLPQNMTPDMSAYKPEVIEQTEAFIPTHPMVRPQHMVPHEGPPDMIDFDDVSLGVDPTQEVQYNQSIDTYGAEQNQTAFGLTHNSGQYQRDVSDGQTYSQSIDTTNPLQDLATEDTNEGSNDDTDVDSNESNQSNQSYSNDVENAEEEKPTIGTNFAEQQNIIDASSPVSLETSTQLADKTEFIGSTQLPQQLNQFEESSEDSAQTDVESPKEGNQPIDSIESTDSLEVNEIKDVMQTNQNVMIGNEESFESKPIEPIEPIETEPQVIESNISFIEDKYEEPIEDNAVNEESEEPIEDNAVNEESDEPIEDNIMNEESDEPIEDIAVNEEPEEHFESNVINEKPTEDRVVSNDEPEESDTFEDIAMNEEPENHEFLDNNIVNTESEEPESSEDNNIVNEEQSKDHLEPEEEVEEEEEKEETNLRTIDETLVETTQDRNVLIETPIVSQSIDKTIDKFVSTNKPKTDFSITQNGTISEPKDKNKLTKNQKKKQRKKKRSNRRQLEQELQKQNIENDDRMDIDDDEDEEIEIEYIPEPIKKDPIYFQYLKVFDKFRTGESDKRDDIPEDEIIDPVKKMMERKKPVELELKDEDEKKDGEPKLSKRKLKQMTRMTVSELKQRVSHPELVEMHDVTARDPLLLLHLKATRNSVPVPRHWCYKRKYLQGKRGFEKPPFKLPEFIRKTGIMEMRQALQEKEESKSLKAKMREKIRPKMGKIDIDYQKLHDAFFKWQTKPKMTIHGDLYYEGKEFETRLKEKKPGELSNELRTALGMPTGPNSQKCPPPWLIAMQRYGPPPSYPNIKIPGLNAPIPDGCSFGYHAGGWGKPPVDEYGRPLYGDVFGVSTVGDQNLIEEEVDRTLWGEMEEESEEEEEDESEEEETEAAAADGKPANAKEVDETGFVTPAEGLITPSGLTSIPAGMETPDMIELRKRKQIEAEMESADNPALFTVIPEKKGEKAGREMMGSAHTYDMSAATLRKGQGIDVALDPSDLEAGSLDSAAVAARYDQTMKEQNSHLAKEDLSDMVAEHAARQKRKNKQDTSKANKKYQFKF